MKRTVGVALMLAVAVPSAFGAFDTYMTFGGWDGPARIEILSVKNQSVLPTEYSTGVLAQGHRKWAPFAISRKVDATSPKLHQFCANGKHIGKVTITVTNRNTSGKSVPFYTITLTNAIVSSYSVSTSDGHPTESISFVFQKIEWTHVPSGKTAMDDWEART